MPIATDESFRIEYSLTKGMEIEFYKSNKVVLRQESVNTFVRPGYFFFFFYCMILSLTDLLIDVEC